MKEDIKKAIIPDGITEITEDMFSFNKDIEEIILPDSVISIADDAFKDCTNLKKIHLSNNLKMIGNGAFEGCTSLEEITIPNSLTYLSNSLFKGCTNLRTITLHDNIEYIDDFALSNCISLTSIRLPKKLKSLGIRCLANCNSIEEIFIPENVQEIEVAALAEMTSLKKIVVDPNNKKYTSDENVALIDKDEGNLIQYAIASDKEEYTIGYYPVEYEGEFKTHYLMYNILNFAFAGAKNLKKLYLPSEIESVAPDTFKDCTNLKKLVVFHSSYGNVFLFRLVEIFNHSASIPFEDIEIEEGITTLADDLSFLFKNAKSVKLPESLEEIGTNVFKNCPHIKVIVIPKNVRSINVNAFDDHITLDINGFKEIQAKDIKMLATQTDKDFRRKALNKYDSKVLVMKDGTYYVFLDDFAPIKVSKDEIESLSSSSNILSNEPEVFLDYLIDLLSINATHHQQLMNIIFNEELKKTFEKFLRDMEYIKMIAANKHENVIRELLRHTDTTDEFLFNGIIMRNLSKNDIIHIIENMNNSLMRILRLSNIFDGNLDEFDSRIKPVVNNIPKLTEYANMLEEFHLYDRFLYNPRFFIQIPDKYQRLLLAHYNANIKRMIIESKILEKADNENQNLTDLLKFAEILGVFSDDVQVSQKATTFITEKILQERDSNGIFNKYKINGDDIHRIFSDLNPREELDDEFIDFFMNNYKSLIELERTTSGFISRAYNVFDDIKKHSSSNKGEQRHLRVTMDRCQNYFLLKTYPNVTKDNMPIAKLLAKFYDDEKLLDIAVSILEESKKAPRNIFGKHSKDENDELVFLNDESEDLSGKVNTYSYEWLPKQDPENLFLGKYCNCCAHISGAGSGIMRASMTTDCVQNLVIKDQLGAIIAKMTLWINRDKGYGVYNTAEINLNHRSYQQLKDIYTTFREATIAFIERYNENNPNNTINVISIGKHRNLLIDEIERDYPNQTITLESFNYGKLGYALGDRIIGVYNGDAHGEQLLVYKK